MQLTSTRNSDITVSFADAIINCVSPDGGLYTPKNEDNLLPWLYYMDENTTFQSIAGALTSAMLKDEFSPLISEAIASRAFSFSPVLKQLDEHLYMLELFHGPTGSHKDFGISYLASCLEHILLMQDGYATIVATTSGEIGASIAFSVKQKKHLKAVLLYAKGTMHGLDEEDLIWNGGNVYPIEIDGDESVCRNVAREIFADKELVAKHHLTLANSVNIGRLLPQTFFYVYAFSRLKNKVSSDIFYSLDAGNYSNLCAGLYSWKFSLPVNGFFTNCTNSLHLDVQGKCQVQDSIVPLEKRGSADVIKPSNIERLEQIFATHPAVMKGLVFPATVSEIEQSDAAKEAFVKYNVLLDPETANAYAAAKKRIDMSDDDTNVVLIARDHPYYSKDKIQFWCGEIPEASENLKRLLLPVKPRETFSPDKTIVAKVFDSM